MPLKNLTRLYSGPELRPLFETFLPDSLGMTLETGSEETFKGFLPNLVHRFIQEGGEVILNWEQGSDDHFEQFGRGHTLERIRGILDPVENVAIHCFRKGVLTSHKKDCEPHAASVELYFDTLQSGD